MKKIIAALSLVFFLSVNFFIVNYYSINKENELLFKDYIVLSIKYNESGNKNSFIKELIEISQKNNVNVAQYVNINENQLNIYATNIKNDKHIKLLNGKYPSLNSNEYISNKENDRFKNNVGNIEFPSTNKKISYFNFEQVKNIGLGNMFYINSDDEDSINAVIELFKRNGTVNISQKSNDPLIPRDINILSLLILTFFCLFTSIIYYTVKQKYSYALKKLFGFSNFHILVKPLKDISFILLGTGILSIIITHIYLRIKHVGFLKSIIGYQSIFLLLIIIIIILCMSALIRIFQKSDLISSLKGNESNKLLRGLLLFGKLIFTMIIFIILGMSLDKQTELKNQLSNLTFWDQTKHIYRLTTSDQGQEQNLSLDRELNNRLVDLYKLLKENKNAFIMDASKYIPLKDTKSETIYAYMSNLKENRPDYGPYGKSVIIDENYLKINPIEFSNGKTIKDHLNSNDDTLNIIVPEKYKSVENEINELYRKYFYMRKVEIYNLNAKSLNIPLSRIQPEDLKVNIVYAKNNQKYFTFDNRLGSIYENHYIKDPIAIIYDGKIDTSSLASYASRCLYFVDNSNETAYQNIEPFLKSTNTNILVSEVQSVYTEVNSRINELKNQNNELETILITLYIITLLISVNYIRLYYYHHSYELYLKTLFGYSFYLRNKVVLYENVLINIVCSISIYTFFNNLAILFAGIVVIILDLIVIFLSSNRLNKQNFNNIIKGGNK
ncbi:DUF1430 domain-containing protein [Bacillus mycoides]|uniref:Bacteriocin-associated integral membrane protein n=1 Tax=Bacillus mycoides TaxID=1405 RepID=A0ABC9QVL8_BACMY|nr:DUF1430 domain-containing protein [Bacillus mycoides]EJR29619.1 bacteriocin-associated integral membrane protein [Bacillus mycoides]